MKDVISIKLDLIKLFRNNNMVEFTEESIREAVDGFKNKPITFNNNAVGIIKDSSEGYLWCEIEPTFIIKEFDGLTIKSFELDSVSLKL